MKIIIGLGNPGEKYQGTRHNLGFMVIDEYAKKHLAVGFSFNVDKKIKAEIIKLDHVWLVKPQTFMNNSGLSVKALVDYYHINLDDLIIVYDELDLPLGQIKIRLGGAGAGHHGVESIIKSLGTDQFLRVRLGIGNRYTKSADKYVLEMWPSGERAKVKHMVKQTIKVLDLILDKGYEAAQNQFN